MPSGTLRIAKTLYTSTKKKNRLTNKIFVLNKKFRKSYRNNKWYEFANQIRRRDNFQCLKCGRNRDQVVLQVHHTKYIKDLEPWEYSYSDCITLCRGCHAEEHNLIEPNSGWTLISVIDLGGKHGVCERKDCGTELRYENEAYHPNWGYKIVGSSCIEFLTEKDKRLSSKVIKIYKNIRNFVHKSDWEIGYTKNNKKYFGTKYKHHILRIYGKENNYTIKIALKEKGEKYYNWESSTSIKTTGKNFNQVKEMAYIVARGLTTEKDNERNMLRDIFKSIK